jgi:drug/metabolite transporter (DMT)-like permease
MKRQVLGFVLLGLVVVIWVLSGFLIQAILQPSEFDHPVMMTVISVGMCAVLLVLRPSNRIKSSQSESLLHAKPMDRSRILFLGCVWLAAQLLYNVSLKYMSVSSNTAISSSSSLFTFIFSLWFLDGYKLTISAMTALVCSTAGVWIIASLQDHTTGQSMSALGAVLATTSCACYGLFTTMLKKIFWVQQHVSR